MLEEEEEEEEDEDVVFLNDPGGVDPSFFSRSFSYVKAKCVENTRGGKFSWIVLFLSNSRVVFGI